MSNENPRAIMVRLSSQCYVAAAAVQCVMTRDMPSGVVVLLASGDSHMAERRDGESLSQAVERVADDINRCLRGACHG